MSEGQKQKIAESLRARTNTQLKRCPKCGETKDRERDFGRRTNGYSRSRCRSCEREDTLTWQKANPKRVREANRRGGLRRYFGLTEGEYDAILDAQNGRCAICRRASTDVPKGRLYVDHCHKTGRIRGLLCSPCNTGIGLLQEEPARFLAAITYLDRPNPHIPLLYANPAVPSGQSRRARV
ncbi:endonuclease VII domain-containing protein [Nonomuraea sp. NPDC059194]|uniref:endonuclease VII domain-containing protein n=1 Tax=Nonomuraea sp. NPDC059194 TaxID=3346764 RepID=UPI0036B2644C